MAQEDERKRQCERFVIFGATLRYRKESIFPTSSQYSEEIYPIVDLSLGGLRFVSQHTMKPGTKIALEIFDPAGAPLLTMKGAVLWARLNPGKSYAFQIGVQFDPYGRKKGSNPPENLQKLIDLEKEFGADRN